MMITKRTAGVMVLLWAAIILCPLYGQAGNNNAVQWEIKAYDDHTIKETVTINNNETNINTFAWEKNVNGDKTILTRTVDDWAAYNTLTDKLPVKAQTKNFFLWHKTTLLVTADEAPAGSIFSQLKGMQGIRIVISMPGYISASSGNRVNEMSTVWEMDSMEALPEGEVMLQAVTFEGFLIGITGFLLGLIIIGIVYMRRMKKVEQLMEAEYSLENIELEQLQDKDKDQDDNNEESSWI